MDAVGVDVQVCHPTGWGIATIEDPAEEIALTRSYNRWMADATAPANGRLRWQVQGAMATPSAVVEELKWGKEHGAIGLHTRGYPHHKVLTDPMYYPIWEACQDLDLPVLVHVGHDGRKDPKNIDPIGVIYNIQTPVIGTFFHLLSSADFHKKFPRLRWIFVECGAMWLPWVVQQTTRPGADLWRDESADWRKRAAEVMVERNLWVTCEPDDDLEYVVKYMGDDRLTVGSDYGHFDMGTDLGAQKQVMANESISLESRRKITDTNARELFRIDASFTPADDARLVSV
jgi:predicted TIM-barrel fold metal-dependent hydrolase